MKKLFAVFLGILALVLTTIVSIGSANAAPEAPHNLVITNVGAGTFDATWQTVSGASEYQITSNGVYAASSTDNNEHVTGVPTCSTLYIQLKAKVNGVWSPLATGSGSKTIYTTGSCCPNGTVSNGTTCAPEPTPTTTPTPTPTPTPTVTPTPTPTPTPVTDSAATKFGWGTPIAAGSDEFNYVGPPSTTKWNNYDTTGHHDNGRRMKAQSTVNGSVLTQVGLSNGDTGYISSKYRPGTMYGKWETRMKTNVRDSEYHPVLLLWPDTGGNATTEDEVDYAEGTDDTSKIKFFLHYGSAGSTTQTTAEKTIDTTQWHNYAVEWTASGVKGYIDGVLWFSDTTASHNPNQPMHQSIQLDWFPNGTTLNRSEMQVDWTRTYK